MQDLFEVFASAFNPNGKIKTNYGDITPNEILDHLNYISYATQRDLGMSHEQLIKIGLGNDSMKEMYSKEQPNSDLPQ